MIRDRTANKSAIGAKWEAIEPRRLNRFAEPQDSRVKASGQVNAHQASGNVEGKKRSRANRSRLAVRPLLEPKGRLRSIHQRPRRESPVSPTVSSAGGATFCSSRFSVRALSLFLRPRPYVSECPCAAGCCNWRRYKNSPIRLPVRLGNTLELAVHNEKGRWSAA